MKCPNCGAELAENAKFCTSCGTNLEAAEAVQEPVAEEAAENNVVENVVEKATEATSDTLSFVKKNLKKIIAVAVLVVVVIAVLVGISSCTKGKDYDYTQLPVLYKTEDGANYLMNGKKNVVVLADDEEYNGDITLSEDGKRIFYMFDGDLYFRKSSDKKETSANDGAVRVAKSIDWYTITPDGKNVLFKKGTDYSRIKAAAEQQAEKIAKDVVDIEYTQDFKTYVYKDIDGDVFVAKNSDNKNKISKDGKCVDFWFSRNDKKVIFVEKNDEGEKTLYCVGLGKNDKPEVLAKNFDDYTFIDKNASELYYTVAETSEKNGKTEVELFYKKGSKDKVKVAENVEEVINKYDGEKDTYYLVTSETKEKDGEEKIEKKLFKLNGAKEPVLVCEDYHDYYNGMTVVVQFEDKERKEDQSYEDWEASCTTYNMFIKDKLYPFELEKTDGDWTVSEGKFYVIEGAKKKEKDSDYYTYNEKGGTLVEYKIGGKGLERKNGKTICEDVTGFELLGSYYQNFNGRMGDEYYKNVNKKMILISSGDDMVVYTGGKTTELEDYEDLIAIEGKTIYYKGDTGDKGEYCIFKFNGSKIEIVAEDVQKHLYVTSKYIYFINEDDELRVVKGKGKSYMLGEDAKSFIGFPVVITEKITKETGSGAYTALVHTNNDYSYDWEY